MEQRLDVPHFDYDTDALERVVSQLHADDAREMPDGPSSDLGGEVPHKELKVRSRREILDIADFGRRILDAPRDERVAVRNEAE